MSDSVALEQKKSRRGLLALVGAGGAAAVAALLGRTSTAQAEPGSFDSNANGTPAVLGEHLFAGIGVKGTSPNGKGVSGSSDTDKGVYGYGGYAGVLGESATGTGVGGGSGNGIGVKGMGKPGVYGVTIQNSGSGVKGEGKASGSIGVLAKNTPKRRALRTKGKVQMDCARKVTLSEMGNTIALPRGVTAATGAAVLAMVQGNPGNDAFIRRAFRIDNRHIRITFNKKPANPVSVAYWVIHTG
jgi:hypothetical protein